jgi:hypothetical protein
MAPEIAKGNQLSRLALIKREQGKISWTLQMTDPLFDPSPAPEPSPAQKWDRDSARRGLDELFTVAHQYNSSKSYLELMEFIGKFRSYSPFNAMLVHMQMPGARFVATAHRWEREFRRQIKAGARPLVILQPMGPVLFVFDVTDTEKLPGAPPLPPWVDDPFGVLAGEVGREFEQTIQNGKRDGVNISERADGSQRAGSIQVAGRHLAPGNAGAAARSCLA